MSPRTKRTSPEDARQIAGHATRNLPCHDCGAGISEACTEPGRGKTVCRSRFIAAAVAIRRQAKTTQRTPEQEAEAAEILARLPRVPREEIEACRTPAGGYSFTKDRLASWGVPWPPPSG